MMTTVYVDQPIKFTLSNKVDIHYVCIYTCTLTPIYVKMSNG